ncbi:DUF998 domain-containing protein [Streptomyces triticagri]|uniref:DUF998 domain-containing protein n=1 Tax=Streptomyces triticagri TaxID=2293568 RepID=A0A372M579_9ACTN|nr:DUF998 domain-containing protein [Streptomyces triticagri]RFU85457.1 DUF998 domain-containing protein [Streptomyces triticagri]
MSRFEPSQSSPSASPPPRTPPAEPHSAEPHPGRPLRAADVLLLLGAVAYSAWLTEMFVATGLDPLRTYVSELAAEGEPLGRLLRSTDLAAGLLLTAAAATALAAGRRPRSRWAVTGLTALAVFGAATVADSRVPLSCTPTADPACAEREAAGLVPGTHVAHTYTSSLAVTAALVAMVALTLAVRRGRRRDLLARTGPWIVAAELAASAWTLASVAAFEAGDGTWLLGLAQRLQVLLIALWLVLFARSLAKGAAP